LVLFAAALHEVISAGGSARDADAVQAALRSLPVSNRTLNPVSIDAHGEAVHEFAFENYVATNDSISVARVGSFFGGASSFGSGYSAAVFAGGASAPPPDVKRPPQPARPTIRNLTDAMAVISWKGFSSHYLRGAPLVSVRVELRRASGELVGTGRVASDDSLSVRFDGLEAETEYSATLQVETRGGASELSSASVFTTQGDGTLDPLKAFWGARRCCCWAGACAGWSSLGGRGSARLMRGRRWTSSGSTRRLRRSPRCSSTCACCPSTSSPPTAASSRTMSAGTT